MARATRVAAGMGLVGAVAGLVFGATAQASEPTKETLLQAWEQVQRADPATVTFEKLGEGRYHFKSTRFPFDGELRVVNASVEEGLGGLGMPKFTGVVETEFVDAPQGFAQKYARSYSYWQATNTLFFDAKSGRWLSTRQWQAQLAQRGRPSWLLVHSNTLFWLLFLAVLVVLLWWLSRRMTRQLEAAKAVQARLLDGHDRVLRLSERSVELAEDSNRVLHEILEALKDGRTT